MHIINVIENILYFILLIVCAITDYTKGKIYNKNIIMFLFAYIIIIISKYIFHFTGFHNELSKLNEMLANEIKGFSLGLLIGFLFYAFGVFKGGDAKLIAVVGLISGLNNIFIHYAFIIITAGFAAVYIMIKNKIFLKRLKKVFFYIKGMIFTRQFYRYNSEIDDNIKFPFAIYILLGEIIAYLYIFKEVLWG